MLTCISTLLQRFSKLRVQINVALSKCSSHCHDERMYLIFVQMGLPEPSYLSEVSFKNRVPVVAYLITVTVLGFIGNMLVLFVYGLKFKPSATQVFVLAMAVWDLMTCIVSLPLQIATIRYAYDTENDAFCKTMFAFATFTTEASGFILIVVAMDRFSRVWRPYGRQLNDNRAGIIVCVVSIAVVVIFAPFVPMYGIHGVDSNGKHTLDPTETVATMCWVADKMVGTHYPFAYGLVVLISFFSGLLLMALSYAFIGARLWKRQGIPRTRYQTSTERRGTVSVHVVSHRSSSFCSENSLTESRFLTSSKGISDTKKKCTERSGPIHPADATVRDQSENHQTVDDLTFAAESSIIEQVDTQPMVNMLSQTVVTVLEQSEAEPVRDEIELTQIEIGSIHSQDSQVTEAPEVKETHVTAVPDVRASLNTVTLTDPQVTQTPEVKETPVIAVPNVGASLNTIALTNKRRKLGVLSKWSHVARVRSEINAKRRLIVMKSVSVVSRHHSRVRSQTTLMMSILTLMYVVNWLPHLAVR